MTSSRGLDRLLAFCDGTVAIAMTLLVLPLVDVAQEAQDRPVPEVLDDHAFELFSFALSFVVIAAFWRLHHAMYDTVEVVSSALVWANLVWLGTIVFLPFPTVLLRADHDKPLTHAVYIGTLVVASGVLSIQRWLILRDDGRRLVPADLVTFGLMVLALVVAVLAPAIGLWSLLVLPLAPSIQRALRARSS